MPWDLLVTTDAGRLLRTRSIPTAVAPGIAIMTIVVVLGGCADNRRESQGIEPPEQHSLLEPVSLRGEILTDTLTLGSPGGVLPMNDFVVVQDSRATHAVQVFDASGGVVTTAGTRGEGPGEFMAPWGISRRPGHPDEFWVYDLRLNRTTPFDLQALVDRRWSSADAAPVRLGASVNIGSPHWLNDSTMVALNSMFAETEGRFAFFRSDGSLMRTAGEPPPGDERISPFIRQQAHGGDIAVHPRRSVFVLASRYGGKLEIYHQDGTFERRLSVPMPFEPDYSAAPDGLNMVRGANFRHGYIGVDATENHIYALFSGRSSEAYPDNANFAEYVHIFTWNGDLLRVLRLDADASSLAVEETERRLYVTTIEPYPRLIAYDLDERLQVSASGSQ